MELTQLISPIYTLKLWGLPNALVNIRHPIAETEIFQRYAVSMLRGVSVRTLQDWEQGRRESSGAAKMLLRVARQHPEVLREMAE